MKRTKLIMTLIICCFSLSVFAFGVYAMILNVEFTLSGKIQFEVDNIVNVKNLQVVVKEEDGTVFKEYDEISINRNGSQLGSFDQPIGNINAYDKQNVEIHIRVQTLTERYVKIRLTHNTIKNNANYTISGVKVRTNSVILAPQSEDGTEKEFIIYVQYINLGNSIQTYTLDNNFVVHFDEMNDILQEDKENGYWYVEMGTIPTETGSDYIRWRYFTSYLDSGDGSFDASKKYTYEPGVRPEPNEDGTGCFVLETNTLSVIRGDSKKLNFCSYSTDYIFDGLDITNPAHKRDNLTTVNANDYATSTIREYINGKNDVYKTSKTTSDGYTFNDAKDKSNMLKDFCIDKNDSIFGGNKISPRLLSDLYKNNQITTDNPFGNISTYKFSTQNLPKDTNGNTLHENESDNFWLLSFWEAYYLLGSQNKIPFGDDDEKIYWYDYYWLRSNYSLYTVTVCGVHEKIFRNLYIHNTDRAARAAFRMKF